MVHSIVSDITKEKSDGNLTSIYENTQGAVYKNIHEYGPYIRNIFREYLRVSTKNRMRKTFPTDGDGKPIRWPLNGFD